MVPEHGVGDAKDNAVSLITDNEIKGAREEEYQVECDDKWLFPNNVMFVKCEFMVVHSDVIRFANEC